MSALQLFCLPYSGASAMFYQRWRRQLPEWLQVRPLELPGRGTRMDEALQTDIGRLVEQLADELMGQARQPYALFGHSLGGLLAFELAHALRVRGMAAPLVLFVSGSAGPARRDFSEYAALESDAELVAKLRELQGTSEEVLACEELLGLTLPILRADFQLAGGYGYRRRAPLHTPIHVLGGKRDGIEVEELLDWQQETCGDFSLDMLEGHHFFIQQQEARVLRLVRRYCEQHLKRWSPVWRQAAG